MSIALFSQTKPKRVFYQKHFFTENLIIKKQNAKKNWKLIFKKIFKIFFFIFENFQNLPTVLQELACKYKRVLMIFQAKSTRVSRQKVRVQKASTFLQSRASYNLNFRKTASRCEFLPGQLFCSQWIQLSCAGNSLVKLLASMELWGRQWRLIKRPQS